MSMFTFDAKPDDGDPYVLECGSRTVLAWERGGRGRSVGQLSGESLSMTAIYGLAYTEAKRSGQFTGTPAEFEASVDIEVRSGKGDDEGEDGGNPTHGDHGTRP